MTIKIDPEFAAKASELKEVQAKLQAMPDGERRME